MHDFGANTHGHVIFIRAREASAEHLYLIQRLRTTQSLSSWKCMRTLSSLIVSWNDIAWSCVWHSCVGIAWPYIMMTWHGLTWWHGTVWHDDMAWHGTVWHNDMTCHELLGWHDMTSGGMSISGMHDMHDTRCLSTTMVSTDLLAIESWDFTDKRHGEKNTGLDDSC